MFLVILDNPTLQKMIRNTQVSLQDINYVDSRPALMMASENGNVALVKQLLECGASAREAHGGGLTPLLVAARQGHREVCEALLDSGANIEETDQTGNTAVFFASSEGHLETLRLFLDKGSRTDLKIPLAEAANRGHIEIVRMLLEWGATVSDALPLLRVVERCHVPECPNLIAQGYDCGSLHTGPKDNQIIRDILKNLLILKTNEPGSASEHPALIHVAAREGFLASVLLLIQIEETIYKTDCLLNVPDMNGCYPMHHAAEMNNAAVLRALLDKGWDQDAVGNTIASFEYLYMRENSFLVNFVNTEYNFLCSLIQQDQHL